MQLLGLSGDTFEKFFESELYKKLKNAILKCKKKVIVFEKLRKTTR